MSDRAVRVRKEPNLLRRILAAIRCAANVLAEMTGRETGKDYVLRPWTEDENAAFAKFCASIDESPSDPAHVEAMKDGPIDFFNNDPWFDQELPLA